MSTVRFSSNAFILVVECRVWAKSLEKLKKYLGRHAVIKRNNIQSTRSFMFF